MTEASTRVVADADVLAADLLCGGPSREALDHVRAHSWMTLVASEPLLDDAEVVIAELADAELAAAWRERVEEAAELVEHPPQDHPGLASAYRGEAAHLLSYDRDLGSAKAGAGMNRHMSLSVRPPDAFARLFDPASLYEAVVGDEYPGPDVDPRG
ncbi:DUF7384 family protein [Haloarchaeobius amylolyticus]|uniref:DUF7384 family protein n=1 Tax=Haloarchaeobius amylolyticus TaxID=1198296 RepID=UPI00226DBC81|nr:hypothetical protein [Haloarchaeobius amylolyticus]